jgi:hypothetical protein
MLAASSGAQTIAETVLSPATSAEDAADVLIAGYDDDPRAAVVALLKIVRTLKDVNRAQRRRAPAGFSQQQSFALSQAS